MAVTRKDVALRAGVSPAVVSFVLNPGSRPVAPETRERVLAAIADLGYRPNALAQALRRGGSRTLGLVQPDQTNPFFGELSQALENHALQHGYSLLVGTSADEEEREVRYVQTFLDRQVDGLILVDSGAPRALDIAAHSDIPFVLVDRVAEIPSYSSVRTDGRAGARQATEHLLTLGHTRIGCIAGTSTLYGDERVDGWREALTMAGLPAQLLARGAFSRKAGMVCAKELVELGATALLACSDVQAVGALAYCRESNLSVPHDVSVVGFDGTDLALYAAPALTVVQQPIEELGRLALECLIERINDDEAQPRQDILPTQLVVRESTAPYTPRSSRSLP